MTTYERIDYLRKGKGITLAHLNEKIGGYRGKLTEVKNGKTTLSADEIAILARELSTSVDYLLGATNDPTPSGEQKRTASEQDGMSEKQKMVVDRIRTMDAQQLDALETILDSIEHLGKGGQ